MGGDLTAAAYAIVVIGIADRLVRPWLDDVRQWVGPASCAISPPTV